MKSALDAASTSLRRLVGSHDENLEHIGDDAVICSKAKFTAANPGFQKAGVAFKVGY